jgi:hypothetical protein
MSETREEPAPEPEPKKVVPTAITILAAAKQLLGQEADKVYAGEDPELREVLNREGIEHCSLTMWFATHMISNSLRRQLSGADVITGEIKRVETSPPEEIDPQVDLRSDWEVFYDYLVSASSSGEASFSNEIQEGRRNMAELREGGKAFWVAEGPPVPLNTGANPVSEASREFWQARREFYNLLALAAVLFDARHVKITRRSFLKLAAAGTGYLALMSLANALKFTAINQQYLDADPGRRVSLRYSEYEGGVDKLGEAYLALTHDPKVAGEFEMLHRVSNQVMVLNTWYLLRAMSGYPGLRKELAADGDVVKVGFFAGGGHRAAKSEFNRGPESLARGLREHVSKIISRYLDDPAPVTSLHYYTNHLAVFASPSLQRKTPISFTADAKPDLPDTPAAIMYRELIIRITSEQDARRKSALELLFGEVVKRQMYTASRYFIKRPGLERDDYEPVDDKTLEDRVMRSGVMPVSLDSSNSEVAIYHHVASVSYGERGKDVRKVGVVIVNGIPFPFFEKENLGFLKR